MSFPKDREFEQAVRTMNQQMPSEVSGMSNIRRDVIDDLIKASPNKYKPRNISSKVKKEENFSSFKKMPNIEYGHIPENLVMFFIGFLSACLLLIFIAVLFN